MNLHQIAVCAAACSSLYLAGCANTFQGASMAIDNFGAKSPREDGSNSAKDRIYSLFKMAHDASSADAPNGKLAMAMAKAAVPLVTQNCDNYFLSNGRQETYLLFGKDILTFGSSLGTAILAASRASSADITAAAIGVSTITGASDIYRKQLTYGADFTNSAKSMVDTSIETFSTAMLNKNSNDYTFELAIQDIRDLQTLCVPSVIIANMSAAIANKQFTAMTITQPSTTPPGNSASGATTGASTQNPSGGGAPEQPKGSATGGRQAQLYLGPNPFAPPPPVAAPGTIPANARLKLVP